MYNPAGVQATGGKIIYDGLKNPHDFTMSAKIRMIFTMKRIIRMTLFGIREFCIRTGPGVLSGCPKDRTLVTMKARGWGQFQTARKADKGIPGL